MDRADARRIAAEENNGVDLPEAGYPLDPASTWAGEWLHTARIAAERGDTQMLGWMWRHCPDIPAPGYRGTLPEVIDHLGYETTYRLD